LDHHTDQHFPSCDLPPASEEKKEGEKGIYNQTEKDDSIEEEFLIKLNLDIIE